MIFEFYRSKLSWWTPMMQPTVSLEDFAASSEGAKLEAAASVVAALPVF